MLDIVKTEEAALFWSRVVFLSVAFVPSLFVHFSYGFPFKRKTLSWQKLALIYLPGIFFSAISMTELNVKGVEISSQYPVKLIPGTGYYLLFICFALYITWALYNLNQTFKQSAGRERMQMFYVFFGIFLVVVLGLTTNVIFVLIGDPFLPSLGPPLYAPIFVLCVSYAIVKHRLMDIRILAWKSVAYSIVLGLIAALYAAGTYLVVKRYGGPVYQDIFNIFVIFFAIFAFNPLRRLVEKSTDRIFAKGTYNFEDLLGKIGEASASNIFLDDLTRSLLEILTREMRVSRAAFLLTNEGVVTEVKATGFRRRAFSTWQKIIDLVKDQPMVVADELKENSKGREVLEKLQIEVAITLRREKEYLGALALGEKKSGDMYTVRDLKLLKLASPQIAVAIENAKLFKEREMRIKELDSLNKLARSLSSTLELDEILNKVIKEAVEVTRAETGSIMLLDNDGLTLSIRSAYGLAPEVVKKTKLRLGEGIAGWVVEHNEAIRIENGWHENKEIQKRLRRNKIASALIVPLSVKQKAIGALSLTSRKKGEVFTEENFNLITSFAAQAAEVIENARLFAMLERQFLETIRTLASAVDAKDSYTYGHSETVTKYAVAIAREMKLPRGEIRNIEIASRLHDIGKIGIPEQILNKPRKLDRQEWEIIKHHPRIGVSILKSASSLADIVPIVLYHHEHFDGSGYPDGLAGRVIPLGARILAVADAFCAMRSDRPYRRALSLEAAVRELREKSGSQFDPEVVEAFLNVLDEVIRDIQGEMDVIVTKLPGRRRN